ncbi:7140_t:CDS:2 [Funneliformis mosseae]|uniref:7140_t:CDS:1 n=1 Tax=Funneliformis mosseae TaxID=27381 RepID=A0A9N8WMP0_FUNMO|nr:7140_t:CDS:2 [Funneliformis mosseae]
MFQREKNGSSLFQSFNSGYSKEVTYTKNQIFTSKIHHLENLSEQINVIEVKNVLEEEQEAFHSKPYDFNIPDDINDFINGSGSKSHSSITSIRNSVSNKFKEIFKLQKNSNEDIQSNSKGKAKQQNNDNDV